MSGSGGSQWADPGLSMGPSCGSVDGEGKHQCWAVKEDSPAHQAWKFIARPTVQLLEQHRRELVSKEMDLMVEIFMIGTEAELASPTVLFSCQNKRVRQKAIELVNGSGILREHPGVLTAECSRRRRPLAMEETEEVPALAPGVYATEPLRHCGVSVLISGEHRSAPRRATLGGIVFIAGLFYGLITLYACKPDSSMANAPETDPHFTFYDSEKSEDESDGKHDSAAVLSLDGMSPTNFSSPSSSRVNSTKSRMSSYRDDNNSTPTALPTQLGSTSTLSRGSSSSSKPEPRPASRRKHLTTLGGEDNISPELGNIFVSAPSNSLDWALVEIENADLMLENISLNNRRFMTNSIYWKNQNLHSQAVHPKGLARRPTDIDVLICTGNRDDALEGRLSGISTWQKAPWSDTFQELWVVRSVNGNFFDGDCGSWVVDCETGHLCGIVVFGLPGTEIAYVIPAAHIFDRMQNHLNKRVELSTPELWSAREEFSKNSKLINSLHRADSAKTIKTEKGKSSLGQPSIRLSLEEEESSRRRSWSQNSIQSTIFDTRSLHSTASSHFSRIPTHLASDTHLSVASNYERFTSSNLPLPRARVRTGSTVSGSSTPSRHIYRPYSTTSTLQSIDSGYGNPPCNNLYVRNLPAEPDEGDLREYFVSMPGFEGLRMKLNEPECFVQFTDTALAMEAQRQSDDHRFSADDKWGIMVGFARNGVAPMHTIPSQEEIELEIGIAELLGAETLPSMREAGGRVARLIKPKRVLTLPHIKQVTDKSEMLTEMFAELGLEARDSDKYLVVGSDEEEGDDD